MSRWADLPGRIPIYIVPLILVVIEAVLRVTTACFATSQVSVKALEFAGPTFASIGIAFIAPLTRREKIVEAPAELQTAAKLYGGEIVAKDEDKFIEWCLIGLLLSIMLWTVTLGISLLEPDIQVCTPRHDLTIPPFHLSQVLGVITYVIGIVLVERKSAILARRQTVPTALPKGSASSSAP